MTKLNYYTPIIKTGDAEMRGLFYLEDKIKNSFTPLFELTRFRKVTKKIKGFKDKQIFELPIDKRIDKIEECIGTNRTFYLDLTDDERLSNERIKELQSSNDGFISWCDFLKTLKKRFPNIIPVLQVSEEGSESLEEFKKNLKKQVQYIEENFDLFMYRFPISDQHYVEDLTDIISVVEDRSKIICCIDMEFMSQGKGMASAPTVSNILKELHLIGITNFIIAGTSFPLSISDYSNKEHDEFKLEEVILFDKIESELKEMKHSKLFYADYACIHPVRNNIMARGWIPRIDCAKEKTLFFYRKRRNGASYADVYCQVAKAMLADKKYKETKKIVGSNCWGIKQIESTADDTPAGLAPSFWISVRLNIAITLRSILLSS